MDLLAPKIHFDADERWCEHQPGPCQPHLEKGGKGLSTNAVSRPLLFIMPAGHVGPCLTWRLPQMEFWHALSRPSFLLQLIPIP